MPLSPRSATALKAAATVLFVGHMLATCVQHIPRDSSLRPLALPFLPYQALTGIWQDWDMFVTIPYLHAYNVTLEVTDADGTQVPAGPLLPGLRPYDGEVRSEGFFTRVLDEEGFATYRDGYERNVCAALRASSGHGGQTLTFHEVFSRIRPIADIRAGGGIGKRDTHAIKFTCD
jgi:hypothetical protein